MEPMGIRQDITWWAVIVGLLALGAFYSVACWRELLAGFSAGGGM
jgi:hypothetical protein